MGGASSLQAQETDTSWTHSATVFAAGSSETSLPFWLHTNQYGTVDPRSPNVGVRLHTKRSFVDDDGLGYALGADLIGRVSSHSTAYLHQLYGRLRYSGIQLTGGRYEQKTGLVDNHLSLGTVTRGRNASPLPRVSISTDGYRPVPGTENALAVNGYFAHGWFEHNRFVQDALLHEKSLRLRILSPEAPITAHVGITHHAMWGGTHPRRGPQPRGIVDWAYVVGGRSRENETGGRATGVNQIASYDLGLDATIGDTQARLYRQFYHEDVPSLWFRNPWDGLWGLRLHREGKSGLVTTLLWEHLRMTRHNARFAQGEERGADTYYHHGVYRGGWTYQGRTIGIPLITSPSTTPGVDDALPGIANSIVVAHHLGLEGNLQSDLQYRLLGTYSRNYGAQGVCSSVDCTSRIDRRTTRRDQYSIQVSVRGPLFKQPSLWFETTAALDVGEFYDNRIGLSAQLTWRGIGIPFK